MVGAALRKGGTVFSPSGLDFARSLITFTKADANRSGYLIDVGLIKIHFQSAQRCLNPSRLHCARL